MGQRPEPLRAALAQINSTVGDLTGNADRIAAAIDHARAEQAQLVVFPELALTGYPPEDLLLKTHFLEATGARAARSWPPTPADIVAVVGFPESAGDTYNAAAVLAEGRVAGVYRKMHLPNYGVFDEQRYFQAGRGARHHRAQRDLDRPVHLRGHLDARAAGQHRGAGRRARDREPVRLALSRAARAWSASRCSSSARATTSAAILFCNLVGGQDELVFDGHSLALDHEGEVVARAPQFEEALTVCTIDPAAVAGARLRDSRRRADVRAPAAAASWPR